MNAPVSSEHSYLLDRAGRQAEVVGALKAVLPAHALLWNNEDTTPYECDGLTAYRERPLVVVLRRAMRRCRLSSKPATPWVCPW